MAISHGVLLSLCILAFCSCGVNENKIPGSPGYIEPVDNNITPEAPSNLEVRALDSGRIYVEWDDNSIVELGFELERQLVYNGVTGDFAAISLFGSNAIDFTDDNVQANRYYNYRVRAFNDNGESGWSNTGGTTTPIAILAPMANN